MVEVELQISEHLGDDDAVFGWHVHPHEEYGGTEVHAHDLSENQHDYVWWFRWGDFVEKL